MANFTYTATEFLPQDSVLDVNMSDFVSSGRADEASWWDFLDQQPLNESARASTGSQLFSTTYLNSASCGVTNDAGLNDPYIDAPEIGGMTFGNIDIEDMMNINDASHDDIWIDHEERSFDYQMPESNQTLWLDNMAPNINNPTRLVLDVVNTSSTSGPGSLLLPAENPFAPVSNHLPSSAGPYLNQDPWLELLVPTNERTLSSWCDNTFGILHTQSQSSTVWDALMMSPDLPATTQCQQYSGPVTNQDYDINTSSGLGYGADADADSFYFASGYTSSTPVPLNLPIRAVNIEHGRESTRSVSSYNRINPPHVNLSFGADTPRPGLQILDLESNRIVNDNSELHRNYPVPLDASSSLVRYTNGAAYTAPASDVNAFSQETDLAYSNVATRTPCPTSTALPHVRRVKRKSAHPVCGPKRPSKNRPKNGCILEASGFHNGYSCLTMVMQGSNVKRPNARGGKPRTKNEQNARDRGVCPPCRKMKLSCVPNDPDDPYGPCQRCVTRYDGAMMHLRGYYLTACRRSFSDFSELLRPQLECREIHRPLYLSCIRIGPMLDFLDLALTGPPSSQLDLATSLRVCMILATLHKFCSQTSDEIYSRFSKMALWYWSKACENLAGEYDRGMTAEDTFELLVQVAADFANHLNQRAVNQGLPRGLLNTTVLNAELARQAWFGYEERDLWYLSVDSKVPLRLPPALVKTIAGGLKKLPGWLHAQSV